MCPPHATAFEDCPCSVHVVEDICGRLRHSGFSLQRSLFAEWRDAHALSAGLPRYLVCLYVEFGGRALSRVVELCHVGALGSRALRGKQRVRLCASGIVNVLQQQFGCVVLLDVVEDVLVKIARDFLGDDVELRTLIAGVRSRDLFASVTDVCRMLCRSYGVRVSLLRAKGCMEASVCESVVAHLGQGVLYSDDLSEMVMAFSDVSLADGLMHACLSVARLHGRVPRDAGFLEVATRARVLQLWRAEVPHRLVWHVGGSAVDFRLRFVSWQFCSRCKLRRVHPRIHFAGPFTVADGEVSFQCGQLGRVCGGIRHVMGWFCLEDERLPPLAPQAVAGEFVMPRRQCIATDSVYVTPRHEEFPRHSQSLGWRVGIDGVSLLVLPREERRALRVVDVVIDLKREHGKVGFAPVFNWKKVEILKARFINRDVRSSLQGERVRFAFDWLLYKNATFKRFHDLQVAHARC